MCDDRKSLNVSHSCCSPYICRRACGAHLITSARTLRVERAGAIRLQSAFANDLAALRRELAVNTPGLAAIMTRGQSIDWNLHFWNDVADPSALYRPQV